MSGEIVAARKSGVPAVINAAHAPARENVNVKVLKAELLSNAGTAIGSRAWEYEDEFAGRYGTLGPVENLQIMEPPFLPRTLEAMCQQNNTLPICIDAMVTNVHGTGFEITTREKAAGAQAKHKKKREEIEAFFNETWPGESFRLLRKKIGRDIEKVGYCYVEVIRNLAGDLIFLRRLDPKMVRLVKKDGAVASKVKVWRAGQTFEATVMMRYRRFVQSLGGTQLRYFKEYNCQRALNAKTGFWADNQPPGAPPLAAEDAATEILYFGSEDDSLTPYSVPRWMPQLPSVLGSRKAEEHNLDFFDAGGIPPIMVFVHGGALTNEAADSLRMHLAGGGRNKHTVPVIETLATGGDVNSAGNVRVTVERFGAERQSDSMFEKYDDKCEKRIRRAWRLPPMFVGAAEDFSFATAQVSYMSAESQVFAPAREDFDEIINRTVMRELDPTGELIFRSKPITIRDMENQLKALEMAVEGKTIKGSQLLEKLNEITNLSLKLDAEDAVIGEDPYADLYGDPSFAPANDPGGAPGAVDPKKPVAKFDPALLADNVFTLFKNGGDGEAFQAVVRDLGKLRKSGLIAFREALAQIVDDSALTPHGGHEHAHNVAQALISLIHGPAQAPA